MSCNPNNSQSQVEQLVDNTKGLDLIEGFGVPLFYAHYDNNGLPLEDKNSFIPGQLGRNIVKWYMSEADTGFSILNWGLFVKPMIESLNDMANAIQEVLDNLYLHSIDNPQVSKHQQHFIADKNTQILGILTSSLSLIPYSEPRSGRKFQIPQLINNQWQQVEYKVQRIKLTSSKYGSPYYAYGLIPRKNKQAQAMLVLMGTNPLPVAQGAHHTLMSDFIPFANVGESLYLFGKDKIKSWLDKQYARTNKPILTVGHSMGGSLAVLVHTLLAPDITQVLAFNPPFWLPSLQKRYDKRKKELAKLNKTVTDNPITIFTQPGDIVSTIGYMLSNKDIDNANKQIKTYLVSSDAGHKASLLARHKDCFSTHSATKNLNYELLQAEDINNSLKRHLLTVLWQVASIPIFTVNIIIMALKVIINYIIKVCKTIIDLHRTNSGNNKANINVKSHTHNQQMIFVNTRTPDKASNSTMTTIKPVLSYRQVLKQQKANETLPCPGLSSRVQPRAC